MGDWTTDDYRNSIGDTKNPDFFSLGYQWADKKHRHVYQLCNWVDDLNRQLAERDATISRQKEMLDEFTRQSHEDRDIIAECEKASYRDGATIARQSEVLKKAWEALKGVIRVAGRRTTEFDAAGTALLAIDEVVK